uniref:Pituitary tumor-transforming 2 n=1 Tax=Mandrillus leucophaeus TaxID=9568 RepID=A0A2K5YYX0_MANLE
MATLICVDKENGEPGTRVAAKDGLKLGSGPSIKALDGISQALGTVKRATEKSVKTNGPSKQKQRLLKKKAIPASNDAYPEIEKFFPFNPLDFESFDLPEERQIAHLPLSGVPLMILDEEGELEKLFQLGPPSPVKMPSPPWECNLLQSPSSILLTLDVELPVVCYDIDI